MLGVGTPYTKLAPSRGRGIKCCRKFIVQQIYDTYHKWRDGKDYEDVQGFCKSADIEEVREHEYILTPGRYVGIEEVEDDGEPFEEKMTRLTGELAEMFTKSHKLEEETVWLTINQMAELFQRDKSVISRHIRNIYQEGELAEKSTVAYFATVQNEGSRSVERRVRLL